jgi:hypothetical protein
VEQAVTGNSADSLRAQLDASLLKLDHLIRDGRQIATALAADPAAPPPLAAARGWQQDCAETVSQLSGGSKAHWLSRGYSGALLVRSADGGAIVEATVGEIVERVIGVLEQARSTLSGPHAGAALSTEAPPTRRFDFVRHAPLRPVLERSLLDSGRALDEGDFARSLMISCGILEAIITDALEAHARLRRWREGEDYDNSGDIRKKAFAEPTDPPISDLSFDERIATAEKAGLIRGGCARLPAVARRYRSSAGPIGAVSGRDATVTRQVLHVVMKDLDPGR